MPAVTVCQVGECAYNQEGACHALAITVGDATHAVCDTYFSYPGRGGDAASTGRVGACKVVGCRHNVDLECQAPGITVGSVWATADCLTYTAR
ncbi:MULTISPECIES: DUF1540 domain-containing protein [Streptomyces]|uniref:DUF1540 domain-containing protein n=1 Tax=Streptomyces morookaense TaxID=1970 RepID=A0A7Y7E9G1_STRMO|nr:MULTISPECIES: DUF1540 domain-containing protein [Streptomyces]MCC2280157.1 DUF1540 domain-containing protein [Streptomyces sp. ET3-23]NVK80988.1 DUF1540 domain-containing protein [Streptomyces morookaense]